MKKIMIGLLGMATGVVGTYAYLSKLTEKDYKEQLQKKEKFKSYYTILERWLMLKQEGKSLEDYFIKSGYNTVAVYGMGKMGSRLIKELEETDIKIKYCMNSDAPTVDINMNEVEKVNLTDVDAVVVTAVFALDEIRGKLAELECPVISIEEVVFGV